MCHVLVTVIVITSSAAVHPKSVLTRSSNRKAVCIVAQNLRSESRLCQPHDRAIRDVATKSIVEWL